MSYKSLFIDNTLVVAGWFLSISDFFISFVSRQRHHILSSIFEQKLSSFLIVSKNKVYDIWNCEKYNTFYLFYMYARYLLDCLYLPSIKIPVHLGNVYALTSYKNGDKIYHVSNNLDDIYHQNKDIIYAILDNHDITPLIKGINVPLSVDVIKDIAHHVFYHIPHNAQPILKIMKDNTYIEIIFKGTEEVNI